MRRFGFAAAGTGGHVVPALAVAAALQQRGVAAGDIVFFTGERAADEAPARAGFRTVTLPLRGLQRSLSTRNLGLPAAVLRARRLAAAAIRDLEVGVVLGTGGYAVVPVGWAAHRSKVTLLLLEPDATPGLGNRIARRWASRVFLGLAASGALGGEVTGIPLRVPLLAPAPGLREEALRRYGLPGESTVLGALGGSLGARIINEGVAAIAAAAGGFAIVHLSGGAAAPDMQRLAGDAPLPWHVRPFEDSMEYFYAAADLVLSRAGAVTVAELAATGTPAVLVPRAAGSGRHQHANAAVLERAGGAVVLTEERAGDLPGVVRPLLAAPERLAGMAGAALAVARPDAAAVVAAAMIETAGEDR